MVPDIDYANYPHNSAVLDSESAAVEQNKTEQDTAPQSAIIAVETYGVEFICQPTIV